MIYACTAYIHMYVTSFTFATYSYMYDVHHGTYLHNIQSPQELYKAPKNYIKPQKYYTKPRKTSKDYTKPKILHRNRN